jgi:hypothetical protein
MAKSELNPDFAKTQAKEVNNVWPRSGFDLEVVEKPNPRGSSLGERNSG